MTYIYSLATTFGGKAFVNSVTVSVSVMMTCTCVGYGDTLSMFPLQGS